MTSVTERAAFLSAQLEALQRTEGIEFDVSTLQPVMERLTGVRDGLKRQTVRGRVFDISLPLQSTAQALTTLAVVRGQVQRDPGLLVRRPQTDDLVSSLGTIVRNARKEVEKEFARRREQWLAVSEEYLRVLRSIPALRASCDEGMELVAELRGLNNESPPEDPAAIQALLDKGHRLLEIKQELDEFDLPETVRSFLDRAQTSKGAPYSTFTAATRDWLEAHGLLSNLRIRLG